LKKKKRCKTQTISSAFNASDSAEPSPWASRSLALFEEALPLEMRKTPTKVSEIPVRKRKI